jgi:hypothetical protein
MKQIKKFVLMGAGFLFVALGVIGFFLPVMPSVPFFILASICFSKSSEKFHDMLMNNKWVGPQIRDYHQNNGIKMSTKIFLIVLQWSGILFTSIFFVHNLFGRVLMLCIAVGVTVYIVSLKTAK